MNLASKTKGITRKLFLLTVFLLTLFAYPITFFSSAYSQSAAELEQQIVDQQNLLINTQSRIQELQAQLDASKSNLESAQTGLPQINAEIEQVSAQIQLNNTQLELLQQNFKLNELLRTQLEQNQKESLKSSYKEWRTYNTDLSTWFDENLEYLKEQSYSRKVFGIGLNTISEVKGVLADITTDMDEAKLVAQKLEEQNSTLIARQQELQAQISYYNSIIALAPVEIGQLQDATSQIANNITNLTQEQQQAAQREQEYLQNPVVTPPQDPGTPPPPVPGQNSFYFFGTGRDYYQGHGVGMSQWGMYGAALNGWNASQIVTFYYTQTAVEARAGSIWVAGDTALEGYVNRQMDLNDYVAGLGEVPDKACGNSSQAQSNPAKYVVDNPSTVWDCWPEEAIKAQVIAARSYAASNGGSICTTAACQVYKGGSAKRWAADETKDLVIVSIGATHTNQIIRALYSSDNSQGTGTAHNDTIFQNIYGDGTFHSYLRAVNDSAFATQTQWTLWGYATLSYNYSAIWEMIDHCANSPTSGYSQSVRDSLRGIMSTIGNVVEISFERDPSLRVKKVWLKGSNGASMPIGGWWFKNMWNTWTFDKGRGDYLFSQTFYLNFN